MTLPPLIAPPARGRNTDTATATATAIATIGSSFEPWSGVGAGCLTRPEESMLKTAVAMVLVKERLRLRLRSSSSSSSSRGSLKRQPDLTLEGGEGGEEPPPTNTNTNTDTASSPTSVLELLFSKHHRQLHRSKFPHTKIRLLAQPHADHMDHLFQVACRLVVAATVTTKDHSQTQTQTHSRNTIKNKNKNNQWALQGAASHLVQQLDAWLDQLDRQDQDQDQAQDQGRKVGQEVGQGQEVKDMDTIDDDEAVPTTTVAAASAPTATAKAPRHGRPRHGLLNKNKNNKKKRRTIRSDQPILDWMATTLVSHPQAVRVHQAMLYMTNGIVGGHRLWAIWWHVATTLLAQLYQGEGIAGVRNNNNNHHHHRNHHSSSGLDVDVDVDALAVALMEWIQTLVERRPRDSPTHPHLHHSSTATASLVLPNGLQDLQQLPWVTPNQLATEGWHAALTANSTDGSGGIAMGHFHPANGAGAGAGGLSGSVKLLVRLGFHRLLLMSATTTTTTTAAGAAAVGGARAVMTTHGSNGLNGGGNYPSFSSHAHQHQHQYQQG